MKALDGYKKLVEKFTDVDSMIIYIDEAHPTDEWFLDIPGKTINILKIRKLSLLLLNSGLLNVTQPTNMDEKISCADHLNSVIQNKMKFKQNIFVDRMDGKLCKLFDAHPEKLAVVKHGKIQFLGGKGPYKVVILKF